MKKVSLLLTLFVFCCGVVHSQHDMGMKNDSGHVMVNATDLKWAEAPPFLNKGAMVSIIEGNPTKEGMFTLRLTFPANFKISPHWHPSVEHVTVIEGGFFMGSGEKFDETKATELKPGGFAVMPAKFPHFAFTKSKTIVQVHAMGPFAFNYVNPADDPRKQVVQ